MTINKADKDSVQKTAEVLRAGGITIIPTDTVYGFSGIVSPNTTASAAATAPATDAKIRAIKGRAETKPLIQLIARPEDLQNYSNDHIPPALLSKWPGALTIIVQLKPELAATAPVPTVAFRCPGDQWLRDVIARTGAPIYSTSVNRSGQPCLDEVAGIEAEFAGEVDLIVADGDKKGAKPSTLVAIENGTVKVLRQGDVQVLQ